MASLRAAGKKLPLAYILSGALVGVALVVGGLYLRRPAPETSLNGPASPEARAYVANLVLSDLSMKASENFMKQQVTEIEGKMTNNGPRPVQSVEVYCVFRGVDGREVYRERAPLVRSRAAPVKPKETRPFRLAFDNLPDGWNQAMPTLVIAHITFGR
ncbi:MAG: hypothetical protein ACJ74Z_09615 [Bryobacteraceae bacterium]